MVKWKRSTLLFWLTIIIVGIVGAGQAVVYEPQASADGLLVINEVMAANQTILADEDGDFSDWIELYNPNRQAINLSGWALTDDAQQPQKWTFPAVSLDGGEYMIVFASGKNRRTITPASSLHTNFKLDRQGEFLALYNLLDERWLPLVEPGLSQQFPDIAYGRAGNGPDYGYLATPTPGQPNEPRLLWQDLASPVTFSVARGFYDSPFLLELETATPGAEIRYTLDGSAPTASHGQVYRSPISISHTSRVRAAAFRPGFRPADSVTHSYIFLDEVLAQPAAPPLGFPAEWGTYRQSYKTAVEGQPAPTDYAMDPDVVNDPRYQDSLKTDLQAIPALFLTINPQDFDIYANPRARGRAWERPVSVEFFDPRQPAAGFQINAGLRIQGDIGREEYIPKHSFRLFFRSDYGPGQLDYPLFPDSPVQQFDTLILRGGVQSSYVSVWTPRRRAATYTRDEWLRRSQLAMSGAGAHGIFAHLYINGLYWGLYNIVERPDQDFAAAYFNLKPEDWYAFNHSGIVNGPEDEIKLLMYEFATANTLAEKIAIAKAHIELTAFADYVILNWYAGTSDWPNNNWYAGYLQPEGQIRYFVWDGELTWRDGAQLGFGISNPPGQLWPNTVEPFFTVLSQDPDFRMLFADRLYKHLFHNGDLTAANARQRWFEINDQINRAIVGESARWGDSQDEPPLNRQDWLAAVDDVAAQMARNPEKLISLTRQAGYYPELDPPGFNQQGGLVEAGFMLTMTASPGEIFYTSDGSDPRLPGGAIAASARIYQQPIALNGPTAVKARVLAHGHWSALNEATFSFVPEDYRLRVTELMYHPAGSDNYEFIELQNVGSQTVDISGWTLSGIRYRFPANSVLAPGQFKLLVRNQAAFAERYPAVAIDGVYDGRLSNKGETIALHDLTGQIALSITYADDNGWPVSADGRGDSLILANFEGDPNDPKSWRASANLQGAPGTSETPVTTPVSSFQNSQP